MKRGRPNPGYDPVLAQPADLPLPYAGGMGYEVNKGEFKLDIS